MKAIEYIECPRCQHRFDAEVEWREGAPFPVYIAECPECDFIIGEDDWEVVKENEVECE